MRSARRRISSGGSGNPPRGATSPPSSCVRFLPKIDARPDAYGNGIAKRRISRPKTQRRTSHLRKFNRCPGRIRCRFRSGMRRSEPHHLTRPVDRANGFSTGVAYVYWTLIDVRKCHGFPRIFDKSRRAAFMTRVLLAIGRRDAPNAIGGCPDRLAPGATLEATQAIACRSRFSVVKTQHPRGNDFCLFRPPDRQDVDGPEGFPWPNTVFPGFRWLAGYPKDGPPARLIGCAPKRGSATSPPPFVYRRYPVPDLINFPSA